MANTKKMFCVALLALVMLTISVNAQGVGACGANNDFNIKTIAPWYCSNINQAIYNQWQQWLPIGFIVVTVSFSIATIIFMFGIALRNQRVKEFGIGEIYEATASAIILSIFMAIAATMLGIIPASFIGPADPYVTSLNYISTTIGQTNALETALFNTVLVDSYYTSFNLNIQVTNKKLTNSNNAQLASAFGKVASTLNTIFGAAIDALFVTPADVISRLLMDGLLALHIEYYLLLFGMYAAIPVFLFPGIILRAFVPTRSLGGMMISVAIGFFFIMPLMFSVAYYFTQANVGNTLNTATQQINHFGQGVGAEENAITPTSPLVSTLQDFSTSMGAFWMDVLFYPALILAITYFSIITMADFIGGFAHGSGKFISQM